MFFIKLINTLKKELNGRKLPRAKVVELYKTKEFRMKFYAIKIGSKFGCNPNGEPISSRNYKYIRNLVQNYNRKLEKEE